MVSACRFRCEQQEDEVDRLVAKRTKTEWAVEPPEETKELPEFRELAMRNRHAVPNAGRAELFALKQDFLNFLFVLPRQPGRTRGQFLDRLFFAVNLQRCN